MALRDVHYLQELKEYFFQKIFDEWETKWKKYPLILKDDFENLPSLNAFVEDLCDDIDNSLKPRVPFVEERKKVLISKENLRRILINGNDIRFQTRTRNCIAYYLGYEGYEDFKEKVAPILKQETAPINYIQVYQSILPKRQVNYQINADENYILNDAIPFWKYKKFKGIILGILLIITAVMSANLYYTWDKNRPFTQEQLSKVRFEFLEQYDKDGISYIQIIYDISSLNCDSALIDYGADQTYLVDTESKMSTYQEKLYILKDTVSHTYFKPNIWEIKLIVRGQTVRTLTKIVYTGKKWISWADSYQNGKAWVSKKKHPKEVYVNGQLWLNKDLIEKESVRDSYYTRHISLQNFDIDGDETYFEVKLKNDYFKGGQSCFDTGIGFKDINQAEVMLNFIENCIQYSYIHIADTKLEGTKEKLYFMDIDLQDWRVISVKFLNKKAFIFIDGKEIYQTNYEGEFDKIKELHINFKGSGSVDRVKLSNAKTGKVIYFDDFKN